MNCRTGLATKWLLAGLVLLLVAPALAQTCLQNEYNLVQKQKLNCTANDVRIAKVTNIRDPQTGQTLTSCMAGQHFNFLADFEIVTTSSQARENIGLYIATESQTQAMTGACVDNIISPQHQCPNALTGVMCGSDNYHETDPSPDNCGDTSSGDFSSTFGAGAQMVTLEIDNFLCAAPAGSNQVQLPNCTSWQIPGGTIQCVSNPPTYPYPLNGPGGTPTAIPGSPAKCNCGIIPLGITVQTPGINVGKACNTIVTTTTPSFSMVGNQLTGSPANCTTSDLNHLEGGDVTYTVDIKNTSNFGSVVVSQVCDSAYGQIYPASGTCNAGTECASPNNVTGTGCATSTTCTNSTIAQNGEYSCTFSVTQGEAKTVTNIASALVSGSTSGTPASGGSNSVTVTSGEAPATATITKGKNATTAACATVRYSVSVANTSGYDESVSLTALSDTAFGGITPVAGALPTGILGTTCGVAAGSPGLGTLSGSTGGGALPYNLPVGSDPYVCYFDAQFCGALDGSGCLSPHTNTVNASMTGDEGPQNVTVTPGSLNLKVCTTTTPQ